MDLKDANLGSIENKRASPIEEALLGLVWQILSGEGGI
jgi:hypothetical protein